MPPKTAFLKAIFVPAMNIKNIFLPLKANNPPVTNPPAIGFQKSSFYLMWTRRHSVMPNSPAHIANEPPKTGALFFNNDIPP